MIFVKNNPIQINIYGINGIYVLFFKNDITVFGFNFYSCLTAAK